MLDLSAISVPSYSDKNLSHSLSSLNNIRLPPSIKSFDHIFDVLSFEKSLNPVR